jgi:hypothetical protein
MVSENTEVVDSHFVRQQVKKTKRYSKVHYDKYVNKEHDRSKKQAKCDLYRKLRASINFSQKDAGSNYPMFEVRASKMVDAGLGVFVTNHQHYIPKKYILPYTGVMSETPTDDEVGRRYQVMVRKGLYLLGVSEYKPKSYWGNWVNRPLSGTLSADEIIAATIPECDQNMKLPNATIKIFGDKAYIRTLKVMTPGTEVLCCYGTSYSI